MEARRHLWPWLVCLSVVHLGGCSGRETSTDSGADGDEGGSEPGIDADADGDAPVEADDTEPAGDADVDGGPAFATSGLGLVATSVTVTSERLCDLDGDGVGDNALAELGASSADSAAMLWNALGEGALGDGYGPGLFFPFLEDRGESMLIALSGDGTGIGGVLRAPYESMDGCGEPVYSYRGELVEAGGLSLSTSAFPVLIGDAVASGAARLTGRLLVGSEGASIETEECLAPTVGSLGRVRGPTQTRGLSLLEVLLGGGGVVGMPGAPGLSPDVDFDGDGLERIMVDGDGHVRECIDGDDTVIAGRDCWADPRMADGIALTRRVRYEETTFDGRLDGWMSHCEAGYARPSVFGEDWNVLGAHQLGIGDFHSCLRSPQGTVRCWGSGLSGRLGYGNEETIGDDERPCDAGDVDLGEGALSVTADLNMTCAILPERRLRCWGDVREHTTTIGDDETPAAGTDFDVGAPVQQLSIGPYHRCALLSGGRVRCWGSGSWGRLGYGDTEDLPVDEAAFAPDVMLGGRAVSITGGYSHTCALLDGGAVRCWGQGAGGRLGYGNEEDVGDDETPAEVAPLDLGGAAVFIHAGFEHTCAVLDGGAIRCWGLGAYGRLGYGNEENVGDDETPAEAGEVQLAGWAVAVAAGAEHTCAIVDDGDVRCWGWGGGGVLGYGNEETIGDDETPADVEPVAVGAAAVELGTGLLHTCALLDGGRVRCWGDGAFGALGYGNIDDVGDDETPADVGDVPVECEP